MYPYIMFHDPLFFWTFFLIDEIKCRVTIRGEERSSELLFSRIAINATANANSICFNLFVTNASINKVSGYNTLCDGLFSVSSIKLAVSHSFDTLYPDSKHHWCIQ